MKSSLIVGFMFLSFVVVGCGGNSSNSGDTSYLEGEGTDYPEDNEEDIDESNSDCISVAYKEQYDNTITIPVKINGMELDMIFDTGASTTCITLAEAQYLYEKGMLTNDDIVDVQEFQTADGAISVGLYIVLREVIIGDNISLSNVEALVVQNQQAPLLLGQSVMKKFREISVDRDNKLIKFYK